MILIDANQIAISHLMVRQKIENEINIETVRKSIISVIGKIAKRFGPEYGELVLCYDDKSYWRRDMFPFYKQNRKSEREASKYNWDEVFSVLNKIRDEIRENFPYRVLQVQGAEADDVIASLCRYISRQVTPEPTLILSADKDFIQLHKYEFVKQYDPIRNRWIADPNPVKYLREHIIKGDRSDGIPNILTCDDAFVTGKIQKKMSKEKISSMASMSPDEFTNYVRIRNWKRNSQLIDFDNIPEVIVNRILTSYTKYKKVDNVSIEYFAKHNLADIMKEFA